MTRPSTRQGRSTTFSPLFIGEGSSTEIALSRCAIAGCLSVPSSSGKGLQLALGGYTKEVREPFSPLFIGEGSSTVNSGFNGIGSPHSFQSPLHRGRVFNGTWIVGINAALPAFQSPLHRGRVFNLLGSRAGDELRVGFQSPLHRGRVFNPRAICAITSETCLSVPSSSGKGLQLKEGSNDGYLIVNFQSPLHRGRVFNEQIIVDAVREMETFSPLFIGEGSSTAGTLSQPQLVRGTFSPLFIGEGSSTGLAPGLDSVAASFSPLFIGEGSSTTPFAI